MKVLEVSLCLRKYFYAVLSEIFSKMCMHLDVRRHSCHLRHILSAVCSFTKPQTLISVLNMKGNLKHI